MAGTRRELNEINYAEHDQNNVAKRVTDVGSLLQTIVDEAGAPGTTYVGRSPAGLATATTGWNLEKVVVSGTTTTITHAVDSWDNRATATYT